MMKRNVESIEEAVSIQAQLVSITSEEELKAKKKSGQRPMLGVARGQLLHWKNGWERTM